MVFARSVTTVWMSALLPLLCATWTVKYWPLFRTTIAAAPAIPCGTSSLIEYALSPTPLTGVTSEVDFIAASKASFERPFGPTATVSVPSADVHTQAESVKPGAGISTSVGGFTPLPSTVCTSELETRSPIARLLDAACALLELAVPVHFVDDDVLVPALAEAAGDAAAPALAEAAGEVTAPALADAPADALAAADAEGDETADEAADDDGAAEDVPSAAGEPDVPAVPDGPHAVAMRNAERAVSANNVDLMRPRGRKGCATSERARRTSGRLRAP